MTLDSTSISTTASSSDTRSTRVWLEDTHVALRRKGSPQINNSRILFLSALDSRNSRGYDVLLYRPPPSEGKKPKAVTYYQGRWHELLHDRVSGKPYLGELRDDAHEHDGDSDPPSRSGNEASGSDSASEAESRQDKGKQRAESSSEDETNQQIRYSPVSVQPLREVSPLRGAISPSVSLPAKRPNIPVLPSPATQRSSIATLATQQPPVTPVNMATTTTTATTTVQPPVQTTTTGTTPAPTTTTADQRVRDRLQAAMRRNPGGPPGG